MNNGFPGGFTPMGNNMGLTCQPNFNGPQPGHCVLHYMDKAPGVSFSHHVSAVQNRAMDIPRLPQKILIDQNELNKGLMTLNKNVERLNISLPSLSNEKNELQKQLTQAQSLLSKALVEQCAAKKEAAEKIPIADEKEKYFIKKYAYNAIRKTCDNVKDRIRDGDMVYRAIAQSQYHWQEWVDFRTQLIQKENSVKRLDDVNLKVNNIRKHIDKITLEIKKIDAQAQVKAQAPARRGIENTIDAELRDILRQSCLRKEYFIANKTKILNELEAKRHNTLYTLDPGRGKINLIQESPSVEIKTPDQKNDENAHDSDIQLLKKINNKDNSLTIFSGNNFLSHIQQVQKNKEIAECENKSQAAICKMTTEAKWAITDLAQGTSFAAGMVAGVPVGLYETVDGIVKTASNPAEAYSALKALSDSGNVLGSLASAVKQSWTDSIDSMEVEYQKGSISGAFNAGVEGGKLTTDIGGLVTGGAGLLKSSLVATEKAVAKVASKAESVAKTATEIALPPASTSERIAGYMAPKGIPETYKAARLANQHAVRNALLMRMPPLENPFPGKALVDRRVLATPQQTKVAGQLLDIGIKASITGITAMALKDVADRITADELNHITALSTAGNPAVTGHYLSSLQDKYAPVHTGNQQLTDTALRNTGSSPSLAPQTPIHTGNNQISGQGVTHTGNTAGVTDSGGYILISPGYDPLSTKDIVYLSEKSSGKIDSIINETLSGRKNFTSLTILTSDEALAAGLKFLGTGYKEIGKPGSGVYHSADGTKEFRIDPGSLGGAHLPGMPHVHFGVKDPETGKYISNNHVPYKD